MERCWLPPCGCPPANGNGSVQQPQLVLYNSYVDKKVPFVPAAGPDSKQISWYTCGPTVYDSAHVGHARNYLSFDIVRRVLEDYFGYNILYVMNVTDVDDKIILRARRNYLLGNYVKQAAGNAQKVRGRTQSAGLEGGAVAGRQQVPVAGLRRCACLCKCCIVCGQRLLQQGEFLGGVGWGPSGGVVL